MIFPDREPMPREMLRDHPLLIVAGLVYIAALVVFWFCW
jgi:hypothetical protein